MSSRKDVIVLVSSSIISISYAGFRKIVDIIIIKNSRNEPNLYPWVTPILMGKVYHCTIFCFTDCLLLAKQSRIIYISI